jgi:hypothetical protein
MQENAKLALASSMTREIALKFVLSVAPSVIFLMYAILYSVMPRKSAQ